VEASTTSSSEVALFGDTVVPVIPILGYDGFWKQVITTDVFWRKAARVT